MDLAPFVDHLRGELSVAAEAGGEEARALAERLTAPLASAARLVLLEALSAAAEEITRDLAPGSVEVRLRGLDPDFVVTSPPSDRPFEEPRDSTPPPPPPPEADEGGGTSRVTLRIPENLKPRIEESAAREGLSVNAWLVRAVTAALQPEERSSSWWSSGLKGGHRYTGWAR